MKSWLWIIPIFGTGIGVGFLVGERYGRQREIDKQEEIRNEEQKRKAEEAKKEEEGPHPIRDEVVKAQEAVKEYAPDEDFDLEKQAKEMEEYLSSEPFPGEDDDPPEQKTKPFDPDIKIVGEQQWEENTEYEMNDLRYFEEDGVFVDESDDRVADPEDHIGQEAVNQFENYPTLDILYVTNDWTNEIYRITRVHDSYGRAILGMDEDFEYYPGM